MSEEKTNETTPSKLELYSPKLSADLKDEYKLLNFTIRKINKKGTVEFNAVYEFRIKKDTDEHDELIQFLLVDVVSIFKKGNITRLSATKEQNNTLLKVLLTAVSNRATEKDYEIFK